MTVATVKTVMAERMPTDARARAEALDIGRSFIVRAPAGSGKTSLLIRRYLKLLERVEQPEEILAMTFTRKAAGEMRLKVLDALCRAEEDAAAKDGHEEQLLAYARAALVRGREKNWRLLENTSRLQFHTIDGFGAQLVRRMPRASGFGAPPAVDDFPRAAYRRAAADAVAALENTGSSEAWAVGILLRHVDNDHGKLCGLLADALEHRDQWLPLVGLGDDEGRRRLGEARRWMIEQVLEKTRASMPSGEAQNITACALHASGNLPESSPLHVCRGMKKIPGADCGGLEQWRGIAELLLTKAGNYRETVTVKQGFPTGDRAAKERMLALLETIKAAAPDWGDALADVRKLPPPQATLAEWRVLVALLRALAQTESRLQRLFAARGACDFTEIAARAAKSLGEPGEPTDLALALDYRIKHILVDEFQDTSHAQVELLELLTAGWDASESRTLFLVGDPQQSIYLFRDADVGIYLRAAKERALAQVQVRLDEIILSANFRSDPKLVEWFNETLGHGMPRRADPLLGAVPYSGADAVRESHADAGVAIHAPRNNTEAAAVAKVVCKERAADPRAKIAILARNRSHLPAILRKLRAANVPCREVNLDSLARRPVVQDLLALTRALLHPADRAAWLALLRAPWCGLQLVELSVVTEGAKTVLENLRDQTVRDKMPPEARRRLARLMAVVEDALARRGRLPVARWVENAWRALGGAALARAEDYEHARDFFAQLDATCAPLGLRDYGELRERVDGLYARRRAADDGDAAGEVQVMTMHGAKGLEFDVVLIPGLERTPKQEPPRALLWNRQRDSGNGGRTGRVLLAPLAAASGEREPMVDFMRDLYARRVALESARLLYVACTRARRKLHLFASLTVKDGAVSAPRKRSLLARIWGAAAVKERFTARALKQAGAAGEGEAAAKIPAFTLARLPADWRLPAGPGAIPLAPVQQADAAAPAPVFEWAGATARATGTLVHRVLCRIAEEGAEKWDEARVRRCCELFKPQLRGLGMNEKDVAHVAERAQAALLFTLGDERGRWIVHRAHADAHSEYALSGIVDGRAKHVIIDRTFTDAGGVRWVIDYKTGEHRGGALEKFLDNEQERYAPQLEAYAKLIAHMPGNERRPVRLGLYFPLARAWREWSPQ